MTSVYDQQPLEPAESFAAFSVYLSLGPDRSLAETGRRLHKGHRRMKKWSVQFNWVSRATAHDADRCLAQLAPSAPGSLAVGSATAEPAAALAPSPAASSRQLPLDQLPTESDKAFAAFKAYVALGPDRSIQKAAASVGRAQDQLAHWSAQYKWLSRIAAHQAHLNRIEQQSAEDLVREKSRDWAKTHEQIRRQAWAKAEELIALADGFQARWRDSDRLPEFSAVLRALELAFKLKQFAAGMPSEVKEVNATVTGVNGGPIRLEFEAAVRKIYGAANDGPGVIDVEASPAAGSSAPSLSESAAPSPPLPVLNQLPPKL